MKGHFLARHPHFLPLHAGWREGHCTESNSANVLPQFVKGGLSAGELAIISEEAVRIPSN